MSVAVREVSLEETLDLRRRVLRDHMPGLAAEVPADHWPGTWHLGAFAGDRVVGVVSGFAEEAPGHPGLSAERFRFMAVEPEYRGRGVGRELMTHVVAGARKRDRRLLWAKGRDTALGFYTGMGFAISGDGFLDDATQLPHHVVLLAL